MKYLSVWVRFFQILVMACDENFLGAAKIGSINSMYLAVNNFGDGLYEAELIGLVLAMKCVAKNRAFKWQLGIVLHHRSYRCLRSRRFYIASSMEAGALITVSNNKGIP